MSDNAKAQITPQANGPRLKFAAIDADAIAKAEAALKSLSGQFAQWLDDEIKKLEDPTGYQDIKNSVTIAAEPIPVSRPEGQGYPRAVTGVAIWDGTSADPSARDAGKKDLADSTRFSIFISGLSNGWVLVDPIIAGKGQTPEVRRKTLQLNFKRIGERLSVDSREISFVPPAEWIYRASLIREAPREKLLAPWDQLLGECPDWPGFRPERRSPTLAAELDRERRKSCVSLRRWMREIEKQSDKP